MTQDEEYLTPEQACAVLQVSARTLARYVEHKKITKYRRGIRRAAFYKRSEIEALLNLRPEER